MYENLFKFLKLSLETQEQHETYTALEIQLANGYCGHLVAYNKMIKIMNK